MKTKHKDNKLIELAGGHSKIAKDLGFKHRGGMERVNNWRYLGIPSKQLLDHYEYFSKLKNKLAKRNMVCIPIVQYAGVGDVELLDLFLKLEKEKGEWDNTIKKALADGKITPNELIGIRKTYLEYAAVSAEIMSRLESMAQKPADKDYLKDFLRAKTPQQGV